MDFLKSFNPIDVLGQLWQNEFNSDEATAQRDWSAEQAGINRNWQERMRATQYQTAVKDMMAAGLNPMLAYQHGGAGTPGGSMPSGASATGSMQIGKLYSAAQLDNLNAQTEKIKADAELTRASTSEVAERTPTHAVTRESLHQQIAESQERIHKIIQETKTSASSAAHLDQQVTNLKEIIPQIRATVNQLKAATHLSYTEAGKAAAIDEETRQRIRQNLPEVERALRILEAQKIQFDQPRQSMDAQTHSSAVGALSSILRALNPLNNFTR